MARCPELNRESTANGVESIRRVGEPLYMRPIDDEGCELEYFWSEEEADAAITDQEVQEALALAGAWSELDADEVLAGLERLRQERKAIRPLNE